MICIPDVRLSKQKRERILQVRFYDLKYTVLKDFLRSSIKYSSQSDFIRLAVFEKIEREENSSNESLVTEMERKIYQLTKNLEELKNKHRNVTND